MIFEAFLVRTGVVRLAILPHPPQYFEPAFAQTAQCGGMAHSLCAFARVIGLSPWAFLASAVGPQMNRVAQHHVARPANAGFVYLPALVSHRAGPGLAAERVGIRINLPRASQFAQQPRSQLLPRSRKRAEDTIIGVLAEGLINALAILIELFFQRLQHVDQAASQQALGGNDRRA